MFPEYHLLIEERRTKVSEGSVENEDASIFAHSELKREVKAPRWLWKSKSKVRITLDDVSERYSLT